MKKESNECNSRIEKIDEMLVLINSAREAAREVARLYDQADERDFGLGHLLRVLFQPRRGVWNQIPQVNSSKMNRAQQKSQHLRNLLREIQQKGNEAQVGQVHFDCLRLQGPSLGTLIPTRGTIKQDYDIVDSNQSQMTNLFGELRQLEAKVKSIRQRRGKEL